MIIVLNRLRETYEQNLLPHQYGFRRNRSTIDGIYLVKNLTSKISGEIFGSFIDLRAAYDHLHRPTLFAILRQRTKAFKIVKILERMYEGTTAKLDNYNEPIPVEVGVRQGGQESPCTFNIMLDYILRVALYKIQEKHPNVGIEFNFDIKNESTNREQRARAATRGHSRAVIVLYADDILIVSRCIRELESMMEIIRQVFSRFGLTMADDKTVTMQWNVTAECREKSSLISLGGVPLENVRSFRYLGHVLTDDPSAPAHITQQISSAWEKWSEMKGVLTDREVQLWVRVKLLEAYIRPRLVYSVQATQLPKSDMDKLETIWINFLRKMVKGGYTRKGNRSAEDEEAEWNWAYKLSNSDVYEICKSGTLRSFCERQHLKYIAHLSRMENNDERKRWCFTKSEHSYARNEWKKRGDMVGIDEAQLRKTMFVRKKFMEWIDEVYPVQPQKRK